MMPGSDRSDAAHPACVAWVGPGSGRTAYGMTTNQAIELGMLQRPVPAGVRLLDPSRMVTFERLAEMMGLPLSEVPALRVQFEDAIPIDYDHPAVQAFLAEHA